MKLFAVLSRARMRVCGFAALAVGVAASLHFEANAFESDVHFGLTRWLALRAGFTESQADSIAIANQRVDGGLVESTELNLEYACAGRFVDVAQLAQRERYPSAAKVPAPLSERAVEPGSAAARQELVGVVAAAKGKEGLMLGKFGHALHALQDSWAHQGIPALPQAAKSLLSCDPSIAFGHPLTRGGPDSHGADLTARWPADTLAMANSTYDELLKWGDIERRPRQSEPWASLVPAITEFARAASKTQKRAWFVAHGMQKTQFLDGISLPDGPDPGPLDWKGRMLPPLPANGSQQHDAPVDVRAFFDQFLLRWLSAEKVEAVVADIGPGREPTKPARAENDAGATPPRELIARLKLWKVRDHGAVADLAHAPSPLRDAQLKAVERVTRDAGVFVQVTTLADAVLSLQPSTPEPMPMLPYIVRTLPSSGAQRMIAVMRLKHAPYDTVGWIAEKRAERWVLVGMVSSVDL